MTITIGIDVGQSRDATAILGLYTYIVNPEDHPDRFAELAGATTQSDLRRGRLAYKCEHEICAIRRVPLGTPYPKAVDEIRDVADELSPYGTVTLVLDGTGVGRALLDMIDIAIPNRSLRAITVTSGHTVTHPDSKLTGVPKVDLVDSLLVVGEQDRLRAVPGLALAPDLAREMADFSRKRNWDTGYESMEASAGRHDDLLFALLLAVWHADKYGSSKAFMRSRLAEVKNR